MLDRYPIFQPESSQKKDYKDKLKRQENVLESFRNTEEE